MNGLCKHNLRICSQCTQITDAAKCMSDRINLMILCQPWDALIHGCMAFYLDDGNSDGVLYPSRREALRFQLRPACVFYFRNTPGGASPLDCQIFLNVNRLAYENDRVAWTDPESPDFIISTRSAEIMRNQLRVRP